MRISGLLVCALLLAGCAAELQDNRLGDVRDLQGLRGAALSLVNEERGRNGASRLRADGALNAAAQAHAEDMARRGFYAHRSPEGRDVMDRYRAAGGGETSIIGENIATCTSCPPTGDQLRKFHQGWMGSPGHRRNILNGQYEAFGFGMASANGRTYAVQTFVGLKDPTSFPFSGPR